MLLHRETLSVRGRVSGMALGVALTVPLLGPVPSEALAQSRAVAFDTRVECQRALAAWTLDRTETPHAFHLRPAVAALIGPGPDASAPRTEIGLGGRIEEGGLRASESVPTAEGYAYPGPTTVPRERMGTASLLMRERTGPVGVVVDAEVADRLEVPVAQIALRSGRVLVSAGRQAPWPGIGCSSGLVLSGRGRFDGVGVDTDWIDLPLLGRPSLSAFVGTLPEGSTDNARPLVLVHRVVWPVADDLRLGLTRAAVFGGRGSDVPVTGRTVALMLLGLTDVKGKDSDFENQVASLDLSWRIPAGTSDVRTHLEYAVDDFGLAFLRVPAVSLGAQLVTPRDDGFLTVDAGLTWIAPSAADHPEWYRHGALAWGWTDRGVLLGHDLGGEGWALRLGGFRSSPTRDVGARILVSRRGDENLLAPEARGWGVELRWEGRVEWASWAGGRILTGWHLDAGRQGEHERLRAALSTSYRF